MEQTLTVTLFDDNGNPFEQTFTVERKFTVDKKEYLALVPTDNDADVYLFDFKEIDSKITLLEIEDDDLYDRVASVYESMMEE